MHTEFDAARLITRLARFEQALPTVVGVLDIDDVRWRPDDSSWSVLEIVCHLGDEEVDDFRTRTMLTLNDPQADWPPIDPEGWARDRDYQSRNFGVELERFVRERAKSVAQLRALDHPDWTQTHTHPKLGAINAGQMLASWCAHDALHLRQISRRIYQLVGRAAPGVNLAYAGAW